LKKTGDGGGQCVPKRSKSFCWLGCTRVWSTVVTPSASDSFSQKNLGLEITINNNFNMKYFNLNNNLNMKYIRAQHTQTSGCTNISTMIEIID
jgi:hypothetical protein